MTERTLWDIMGRLSAYRKVGDHYLSRPLNDPDLPHLLADTLQRNFEVRDAIDGLLPKNRGPTWVKEANYTLKSASERMDLNEAEVRRLCTALKMRAEA